jgi:hypothetical protein
MPRNFFQSISQNALYICKYGISMQYRYTQNYLVLGFYSKSKNPVILTVIHHRQNPLESTCTTGMDPVYIPLGNQWTKTKNPIT